MGVAWGTEEKWALSQLASRLATRQSLRPISGKCEGSSFKDHLLQMQATEILFTLGGRLVIMLCACLSVLLY